MRSVVSDVIPDNDALVGERARLLAHVDILESVSPEDVRALARCSTFTSLDEQDAILLVPDDHAESLYLLLEGRVRLYEEGGSGRELTFSVVNSGALVGATGFASPAHELRIEILEPSIICCVERRAFEELAARNPALGIRVARLLGERLLETEARLADITCKEVPRRLASQVLRLIESEGMVTREGYKIPTRYTHQQLGTMIGANREAVTRAFGKLKSEGGVELRNRRILVTDPGALEQAARR